MRLGTCERCGIYRIWVNQLTCMHKDHGGQTREFSGQACAECFEKLGVLGRRPPSRNASSNPDPSIENAVRAWEGE